MFKADFFYTKFHFKFLGHWHHKFSLSSCLIVTSSHPLQVNCTFSSKQSRKYDPDVEAAPKDMICSQPHYYMNNDDS